MRGRRILPGGDSVPAASALQGRDLCSPAALLQPPSAGAASLAWVLGIPRVCGTVAVLLCGTTCPTGTLFPSYPILDESPSDTLPDPCLMQNSSGKCI